MTRAPLSHEYDGAPELPPDTPTNTSGIYTAALVVTGLLVAGAAAAVLLAGALQWVWLLFMGPT